MICARENSPQCLYAHLVLHLNYYPAIAEAFYSQIPLIVISADRPQSKIDIGDDKPSDKRMYSRIILCTMPI
jgi:hypothetical protein